MPPTICPSKDLPTLLRLVNSQQGLISLFKLYEAEVLASEELKALFKQKQEDIKKKRFLFPFGRTYS